MKSARSRSRRRLNSSLPPVASHEGRSLFRRLLVESLEERRVLATLTWVGDVPGQETLWGAVDGTNTNWSGNALPADNDTLVFDGNGATFDLINDIAGLDNLNLVFTDAIAAEDYSISGNTLGLKATGIASTVTVGT